MSFFVRMVSDEYGNISHHRFVNVLIGVCSCLMMWKLVILGQATEALWGLWLAYGAGLAGWSKYVEHKDKTVTAEPSEPSLKPPKE